MQAARQHVFPGERPGRWTTIVHPLDQFVHELDGQRVVIRIEPGAHGIYAVRGKSRGLLGKLKGAANVRGHVRDQLIAKPTDRTVRYEPGAPDGRGTYGLRLLTASQLKKLSGMFESTPGNGARTPDQWADGDKVAPGELFESPDAVFRRLLQWSPAGPRRA